MNKVRLGNSSLKVSNIGLGAINFGTKTSEKDSFELMDLYYSLGGNFIDTSNNYAVWNGGNGSESEKVIGNWLKTRGNREDVIIATKLGALPKDLSKRGFSDMQGLSRKVILDSVEKSLKNLQTDYIDLLYLHVDDFETSQIEVMSTLNKLVLKGLVKEIGCSNFYSWRIESARVICNDNNFKFFCAVQQRFSYLAPTIDSDFYPQVPMNKEMEKYIEHYKDLTLVAYSPLLGGQYNQKEIKKKEYMTEFNVKKLEKLVNEEGNPNEWVLDYITKSYGGSVALLTTSNKGHLSSILQKVN